MELQYKFIESMWSNLQRTKVGKKVVSSESENLTIRNKRENKKRKLNAEWRGGLVYAKRYPKVKASLATEPKCK